MVTRQQPELRPHLIKESEIDVNPYNPRAEIEEGDRFWSLVRSIEEFGIQVPLLVAKHEADHYRYLLVDGERRLYAARKLAMEHVPAHVLAEMPSEDVVLKRMFQIHHNREEWGPLEECKALEPFYRELKEDTQIATESALLDELVERTGLKRRTAADRLHFLRWPEDLRIRVREGFATYWFVVELEKRIVAPAKTNFPEYVEEIGGENELRRLLLDKWASAKVTAARNVRDVAVIATHRPPKEKRDQALRIFKTLVHRREYTFDEAREEYVSVFPEADKKPLPGPRALHNRINNLSEQIQRYDVARIVPPDRKPPFSPAILLESLNELIRSCEELVRAVEDRLEDREA